MGFEPMSPVPQTDVIGHFTIDTIMAEGGVLETHCIHSSLFSKQVWYPDQFTFPGTVIWIRTRTGGGLSSLPLPLGYDSLVLSLGFEPRLDRF